MACGVAESLLRRTAACTDNRLLPCKLRRVVSRCKRSACRAQQAKELWLQTEHLVSWKTVVLQS